MKIIHRQQVNLKCNNIIFFKKNLFKIYQIMKTRRKAWRRKIMIKPNRCEHYHPLLTDL